MLEAAKARPRFTISLKRSTQNLQLSTRTPADYPIFWPKADITPLVNNARCQSPWLSIHNAPAALVHLMAEALEWEISKLDV
jgi:hypothetical protein